MRASVPVIRQFDANVHSLAFEESESFGDIGTNMPLPGTLPPSLLALLAGGGTAIFLFGTKPAVEGMIAGVRNLRRLGSECKELERVQAALGTPADPARAQDAWNIAAQLDLNRRDCAAEKIQHLLGDSCIAVGSSMTGVGTFLTPGFLAPASAGTALAANLLTGWLGNSFIAGYSLAEAGWEVWTYYRTGELQEICQTADLNATWDEGTDVNRLVAERLTAIKDQAVLTGISAVGLGAGGLLTAVTFYGYAVLVPFAALRFYADYRGRIDVGYVRRLGGLESVQLSQRTVLSDIIYAADMCAALAALRDTRHALHPHDGSPQCRLHAFFQAQALREQGWLTRQQRIVTPYASRTHLGALRLREVPLAEPAATLYAQLDARQDALGEDATFLADSADKELTPSAMLRWIERVVAFFAEHGSLGDLVQGLCNDPRLGDVVCASLTTDADGLLWADAVDLQATLNHLLNGTDVAGREAFFACVEKILVKEMAVYFSHLQRELIDVLVARLRQQALANDMPTGGSGEPGDFLAKQAMQLRQ